MSSSKTETYLDDFTQFLTQHNIIGMGIGTLVAISALQMGWQFTEAIVQPLLKAIMTLASGGQFDLSAAIRCKSEGLVKAILNFIVTMFIIFFFVRLFDIKMTRWVQYVKVVNNDPDYNHLS